MSDFTRNGIESGYFTSSPKGKSVSFLNFVVVVFLVAFVSADVVVVVVVVLFVAVAIMSGS